VFAVFPLVRMWRTLGALVFCQGLVSQGMFAQLFAQCTELLQLAETLKRAAKTAWARG